MRHCQWCSQKFSIGATGNLGVGAGVVILTTPLVIPSLSNVLLMKTTHLCMAVPQERSITVPNLSAACMSPLDEMEHVVSPSAVVWSRDILINCQSGWWKCLYISGHKARRRCCCSMCATCMGSFFLLWKRWRQHKASKDYKQTKGKNPWCQP